MSTRYSLVVKNNSNNSGSFCLYQKQPDLLPNAYSLAWFARPTRPTTMTSFDWTLDYSFVWSETGRLVPGVIFDASEMVPADPASANQITLTNNGGAFTFQDQSHGPQSGTLYIREASSIPMNLAAVGIGMSGSGTFVTQAQPNMNLQFTPRPSYWIAFGNFEQGEVLDVEALSNTAQIEFPPGVYSMEATLNADNTWTI